MALLRTHAVQRILRWACVSAVLNGLILLLCL